MILTISGNNDEYIKMAAETAKELLKDLKAEIKSIKDMPNYRPNRQLFGGGDDFDVWIITDCKTAEDLEPVKKGITILIDDIKGTSFKEEFKSVFKELIYVEEGEEVFITDSIHDILVHYKIIYPVTQKEA